MKNIHMKSPACLHPRFLCREPLPAAPPSSDREPTRNTLYKLTANELEPKWHVRPWLIHMSTNHKNIYTSNQGVTKTIEDLNWLYSAGVLDGETRERKIMFTGQISYHLNRTQRVPNLNATHLIITTICSCDVPLPTA